MSELTDYAERQVLDYLFNNPECYIGLYSALPTDAGGGTEVTTTIRVAGRVASTFAAAAGTTGVIANASIVDFGAAAGGATVVGFGIFDAATAGNLLAYSPLDGGSATIAAGNLVSFAVGALTATIA
jgi:hypothetical protein